MPPDGRAVPIGAVRRMRAGFRTGWQDCALGRLQRGTGSGGRAHASNFVCIQSAFAFSCCSDRVLRIRPPTASLFAVWKKVLSRRP
jgi:hypothetical protein